MNDEQYADWAARIRATNPPEEANRILETGGPEQHAATIRLALNMGEGLGVRVQDQYMAPAKEALDALVALAGEADQLRAALQEARDWLAENAERPAHIISHIDAALAGVHAKEEP